MFEGTKHGADLVDWNGLTVELGPLVSNWKGFWMLVGYLRSISAYCICMEKKFFTLVGLERESFVPV